MTTSKDEHSVRSKEPARKRIKAEIEIFLKAGCLIEVIPSGQGVNPPAYRAF